MNETLRKRLIAATCTGALAIAAILGNHFEGTRYTPYRDTGGVWTVCEGITGSDVIQGKTYTRAECDALGDKHRRIAAAAVDRVIKVPLTEWMRAALIDFTFNLGETALRNSTMAKLFNAGQYAPACDQLNRWVKGRVNGQLVTLNGLVARRGADAEICMWDTK